jgi:hypothetical protein
LELFEDRTLLSVVNWIGGSGDWNTPTNWEGGELPGPDDDAVISVAGITVTHSTTAYDQIKTLELVDGAGITLELTSGTLGVVDADFNDNTVSVKGQATLMIHSQAVSTGHFEMVEFDATISGAGTLTTHGDALWSAGVLDGDWTVPSGSTLTISGPENKLVRGTLTNAGTVLWSGIGRIGVSSLTVINNLEGGLWVCQNDTPFAFRNDDGFATHPFNNYGTFRKDGGSGQTSFDSFGPFHNFGRVEVKTGTLIMAGGGTSSGVFEVADGAHLQFITFNLNYDLNAGTTFEGQGKVWVTLGGTLSVNAPITVGNPMEMNAGTIRGVGPLTATNTFLWSGGQITGNFDVGPDATMSITGILSMVIKGTFNNFGTIIWTAPGPIAVTARSVVTNHEGAVFDFRNDQPIEFHEDDGFAPWAFQNDGLLLKSAGTGTSLIEHALFSNEGTIEVATGTMFFDTDYFTSIDDNTLAGGAYVIKGALKINGADIHVNVATLVLDGPNAQFVNDTDADALENLTGNVGVLRLLNGKELTTGGSFGNQGWLAVGGGSQLTVNGNLTQTNGVMTLEEGTIAATLVRIQGGQLNGYGTVVGNVNNSALVHLGTTETRGILTVDGDYTQTAGGALVLRLGGPNAGVEYDQLQVTGTATLDGVLGVFVVGGFVPTAGDSFRVVVAEATTGTFSKLRGAALTMDVVYDPNGVVLESPTRSIRNYGRTLAKYARTLARTTTDRTRG